MLGDAGSWFPDIVHSIGRTPLVRRIARQREHEGRTIVVILPDSGERYLSLALFDGVFDGRGLAL